jgi:hypothetical protein
MDPVAMPDLKRGSVTVRAEVRGGAPEFRAAISYSI